MTDITELAPAMKAAANKTADAIDRLKAFPGDELIDLSQHEGEQVDIDITTINEWYELSSPANILALVEALEKAQQHIARQEQILLNQDESLSIRSGELEAAQQERENWRTSFDNERFRADKLKAHIDDIEPIRASAEKLVRCKGRYHSEQNYRALAALFGVNTPDLPPLDGEPVGEVIEVGDALLVEWHKNLEEGAKLYSTPQVPVMPFGLHPDTQKLVTDFCTALAEKLYKAQLKYGYDTDWKHDGWPSQCQAHFHQHIAKGDPRDVAAYCAFMWWHGWSTKPAEDLESRTVTVKLPDYRNTYKSPLADEVEHQVRLALELFSSAAGIKWEAE